MAINDLYRLTLNGTVRTQPFTSRFFLQETASTSLSAYDAAREIANEFESRFVTSLLPQLSQSAALVSLVVNRIKPTTDQTYTYFFDSGDTGTVLDEILTEVAAAVVRFKTETAGKAGRGRWFVPGVANQDTVGGQLKTQFAADLSGAAIAIFADFTDTGQGTYRHTLNSNSVGLQNEVTDYEVNPIMGTQRRRRARGLGYTA